MLKKAISTTFENQSSKERINTIKSFGSNSMVNGIANFHFPFLTKEYHHGLVDDYIEATRQLIEDANIYLDYLNRIKS